LTDSNANLKTWEELSGQFRQTLDKQSATLEKALIRAETSEANSRLLTPLLDELSKDNANLRIGINQIGEKMQERDEDLAWAYGELDSKDLEIAKKDVKIAKQTTQIIILYVILGLIVIGGIAIAIIKGYIKMKLPIRL
jgi:hypothetical protein